MHFWNEISFWMESYLRLSVRVCVRVCERVCVWVCVFSREIEKCLSFKSPNQEEPIERTKVEQTIRDNQKLRFKWQKQKKREIVRGSFNTGLFSGIQKLRVKRKWCTLVKVKRICYYLSWNLDGWLGRNQLLLVTKKCETMKTLVYKKTKHIWGIGTQNIFLNLFEFFQHLNVKVKLTNWNVLWYN